MNDLDAIYTELVALYSKCLLTWEEKQRGKMLLLQLHKLCAAKFAPEKGDLYSD